MLIMGPETRCQHYNDSLGRLPVYEAEACSSEGLANLPGPFGLEVQNLRLTVAR